jgi:hypothetical protein
VVILEEGSGKPGFSVFPAVKALKEEAAVVTKDPGLDEFNSIEGGVDQFNHWVHLSFFD